jgi:hypothetical protein
MKIEDLYKELDSCLEYGDMACFNKQIDTLFKFFSITEA